MTRRQRRAGHDVGNAKRPLEHDFALVGDGNGAARLLQLLQLVVEPAWYVIERGLEPVGHVLLLLSASSWPGIAVRRTASLRSPAPGYPRFSRGGCCKTWMPGSSPGTT